MKTVLIVLFALTWGRVAVAQVTMYEHVNYQGDSKSFGAGEVARLGDKNTNPIFSRLGFGCTDICNDIISSVKVPPGWIVTVWEHENFAGRSLTFTADCPNLVPLAFNDIITSFQVERTHPASPPVPCEVFMTLKNGFSFPVYVFYYEWPVGTTLDWCAMRGAGYQLGLGKTARRLIPVNKTLVYGFYENDQSCLDNYKRAYGSIYRSAVGCGENAMTVGQ